MIKPTNQPGVAARPHATTKATRLTVVRLSINFMYLSIVGKISYLYFIGVYS
jgi:hypothetical protein